VSSATIPDDLKVPTDQTLQEAAVAMIDQLPRLYYRDKSNLRMSAQSEPKKIDSTMVPKRLNKRIGLRPIWSERRLLWSMVATSTA
jgi:hypothetical protein